ncbi:MAG TPA: hypothetical protein VKC56_12665 [Gallionellaceae bacterium]|nr:hypothetical protein [Gallionellaceae bacterium]
MTTPTPANQLNIRISWLAIVNYLGALLTTGWMLYLLYGSAGLVYALLALLVSGFILRFGASPLLVIAAGILYFHFHAAGLWLPALCWLAAGAAFLNDLQDYRMRHSPGQEPASQASDQQPSGQQASGRRSQRRQPPAQP